MPSRRTWPTQRETRAPLKMRAPVKTRARQATRAPEWQTGPRRPTPATPRQSTRGTRRSRSGSGGSNPPLDASSDSAPEGSTLDAAGEAGAVDAGYPGPTLVQSGANLKMRGMTADDYVVYISRTTNTYFAQSIAPGSTPTQLYALSSSQSGIVSVLGDLVFVWGYASYYAATVTLWSSALSTPLPLSSTAYAGDVWASADSQHFAYVSVTGTSGVLVGSIVGVDVDASGAHPRTLVTNVDLSHCSVSVRFAGSYAVAGYCPASDAGTTQTVQSFSVADDWSPSLVVHDNLGSFAVDPNGQEVVAASTSTGNGDLQVFPIDGGGAGTVLDTATALSGQVILGSPTYPWSIDYTTQAGGLMQTFVTNPAPQLLVDGGVSYLDARSVDGKWLLVTNQVSSGQYLDFSLVSTTNPGTPQLVAASTQYGSLPLGLSASLGTFTTDGQSVLFYSNWAESSAGLYVGYLHSMSIASPSTYRLLSNGYGYDDVALQGSKVLLLDDFQLPDGGTIPTVDLEVVDLSTTKPAQLIASGVPREVAVSTDLSKFAYVVLQGPTAGVYVAPVP